MDAKAQSQLVQSLLKSLLELREKKGAIHIEDLGLMMEKMSAALQANSEPTQFLRSEFGKIAEQIGKAKTEIVALTPKEENSPENIDHATDQLDAVVQMTEEASNKIMDAADEIQNAIDAGGDDTKEKVESAIAEIFLACNFQDITGQRINKVLTTLNIIDERVKNIMRLFAKMDESSLNGSDKAALDDKNASEREKGLLDGPALPAEKVTQDDIDALFN